jgi:hypothetical protein
MGRRLRQFTLTVHVACSVGSLGAVLAFLILAVSGMQSSDEITVRSGYVAMHFIAGWVILPLISAALLTGLVQALGTPWGLFRHYWVLAKLCLTVITLLVLVGQMAGIVHVAEAAAERALSSSDLSPLRSSMKLHAVGGLGVLLLIVGLSIYKPRGLTRYGWQKRYGR